MAYRRRLHTGYKASWKRANCSKSAITKPISGCARIAHSGFMMLQVVNRFAASCELHAGLMHQLAATLRISSCSKSDVPRPEVNSLDTNCRQLASAPENQQFVSTL